MRLWTRLIDWTYEEVRSAEIYRRLSQAARLHGQGEAGLWRDPELQVAVNWRQIAPSDRGVGAAVRAGLRPARSRSSPKARRRATARSPTRSDSSIWTRRVAVALATLCRDLRSGAGSTPSRSEARRRHRPSAPWPRRRPRVRRRRRPCREGCRRSPSDRTPRRESRKPTPRRRTAIAEQRRAQLEAIRATAEEDKAQQQARVALEQRGIAEAQTREAEKRRTEALAAESRAEAARVEAERQSTTRGRRKNPGRSGARRVRAAGPPDPCTGPRRQGRRSMGRRPATTRGAPGATGLPLDQGQWRRYRRCRHLFGAADLAQFAGAELRPQLSRSRGCGSSDPAHA